MAGPIEHRKRERKESETNQEASALVEVAWAGKRLPTSWHVRPTYRTGLDHAAAELRTSTSGKGVHGNTLSVDDFSQATEGASCRKEIKPTSCLSVLLFCLPDLLSSRAPQVLASHGNLHYTLKSEMLLCLCSIREGTWSQMPKTLCQQSLLTYLLVVRCTVSAVFALAHHSAAAPGVDSAVAPQVTAHLVLCIEAFRHHPLLTHPHQSNFHGQWQVGLIAVWAACSHRHMLVHRGSAFIHIWGQQGTRFVRVRSHGFLCLSHQCTHFGIQLGQ